MRSRNRNQKIPDELFRPAFSGALAVYIGFWAAWWFWIQTVGRLPAGFGTGLTLSSGLLFDLLFFGGLIFYFRKKSLLPWLPLTLKAWSKPAPDEIPFFLKALAWLVVASIGFTAGFQAPFDWDGMDYHLPPLVEAWQAGSWGPSENPYFAARTYPKTAGSLYLWWLCHFGKLGGLPCILLISLLHWQAGLVASLRLLGRSKWVYLFWVAFPLAARQAVSGYADLAGLSSLLAFVVLALDRRFWVAALALGLHGSIKFTNIASAGGAVLGLALWIWYTRTERKHWPLWRWAVLGMVLSGFALVQPLQNIRREGKPFGELQCKILGKDWCGGSIDPSTLVVSPTVTISADKPWIGKVLEGWTPNQAIPNADVPHGGFGWIILIALGIGIRLLSGRVKNFSPKGNVYLLGSSFVHSPAGMAFAVLLFADLAIPALWYPRYHMALGWCLLMGIALWMGVTKNRAMKTAAIVLLSLQLAWLIPQRTWFLGVHSTSDWQKVYENLKNIVWNGYPLHATHQADLRSIALYQTKKKNLVICGPDLRPSLAAYGADLTNRVQWYDTFWRPPCPRTTVPPSIEIGTTKIWGL